MRKFVVSDLHGNGNMYYSIISYLENIYKYEDVILYIIGDLIDYGYDSGKILLDIKDRIENNKGFKIVYLGGNHELSFYKASLKMKNNNWPKDIDWYLLKGGNVTCDYLNKTTSLDEQKRLIDFISKLPVIKLLEDKFNDKNIVLAHAKCPNDLGKALKLKIKDDNKLIKDILTNRDNISNKKYFTIVGHTPNINKYGYDYNKKYLNIDGGCSRFVRGNMLYNHTPLVEIDSKNNQLILLIFNNNNEIVYGKHLINNNDLLMSDFELNNYREFINKDIKIRKLTYNKKLNCMIHDD